MESPNVPYREAIKKSSQGVKRALTGIPSWPGWI